jgi:acyl-coenzyme A synthetase/AMP-(fatty) acid ligase
MAPCSGRAATVITSPRDLKEHFKLMRDTKSNVELVPVVVTYWMEAEDLRRKYDLSSLRVIRLRCPKVKPELVKWCMEELGVYFTNTFGMTERTHICTRWHNPLEVQCNTVGGLHPGSFVGRQTGG